MGNEPWVKSNEQWLGGVVARTVLITAEVLARPILYKAIPFTISQTTVI
jgi:hypothetical protein